MATFKKTLLALGGASVLAIGMSFASAPVYAAGDEADAEWLTSIQSGSAGGGANLSVPTPVSGPLTKCSDVRAAPGSYASNIVAYCSTHRS